MQEEFTVAACGHIEMMNDMGIGDRSGLAMGVEFGVTLMWHASHGASRHLHQPLHLTDQRPGERHQHGEQRERSH